MPGQIPVGEIHHLRLTVTDIKRSREFYTGLLGFQVAAESPPPGDPAEAETFKVLFGAGSNTRTASKGLGRSSGQLRGARNSRIDCAFTRIRMESRSLRRVGRNSRRYRSESGTNGAT